MESKELIIKHANVIFSELTDKGFGRSIVIDATDEEMQKQINDWSAENGVKPKFKDYTNKEGKTTKQYTIKLSEFTQIEGQEGEKSLGYGAVVNVIIRAFEYSNKFGKGKSCSASGIFVVEPKTDTVMSKIAE